MKLFTASICNMLEVLFASMSQKSQPPSLYDVLMQIYKSCLMVARVLCIVARKWLDSCQWWISNGCLSLWMI